jgi:hypothetical protein
MCGGTTGWQLRAPRRVALQHKVEPAIVCLMRSLCLRKELVRWLKQALLSKVTQLAPLLSLGGCTTALVALCSA